MTVRLYQSTDAGAPVLAYNVAGSLIGVLDACLVDGYGDKEPAGWTKPFSGTNLAAYRQGAGGMQYLSVSDSLIAAHSYASVRAYEFMTDLSAGTNPYPTAIQYSGGLRAFKAYSNNSSSWTIIADERAFYLHVRSSSYGVLYFFGDLVPLDSGDEYATLLCASPGNVTSITDAALGYVSTSVVASPINDGFVRRSYDAATFSLACSRHTDSAKNSNSNRLGTGGLSYPNTPDGGAYFAPVWTHETNNGGTYVRATLPGLWCPLSISATTGHQSILEISTGDLSGRRLFFLTPASSTLGYAAIETSDTWR